MEADIRHMKWWGWGYEDVTFDDSNKPELWPYLKRELGVGDIRWDKPVGMGSEEFPSRLLCYKCEEKGVSQLAKVKCLGCPRIRSIFCDNCFASTHRSRHFFLPPSAHFL